MINSSGGANPKSLYYFVKDGNGDLLDPAGGVFDVPLVDPNDPDNFTNSGVATVVGAASLPSKGKLLIECGQNTDVSGSEGDNVWASACHACHDRVKLGGPEPTVSGARPDCGGDLASRQEFRDEARPGRAEGGVDRVEREPDDGPPQLGDDPIEDVDRVVLPLLRNREPPAPRTQAANGARGAVEHERLLHMTGTADLETMAGPLPGRQRRV